MTERKLGLGLLSVDFSKFGQWVVRWNFQKIHLLVTNSAIISPKAFHTEILFYQAYFGAKMQHRQRHLLCVLNLCSHAWTL